MDSLVITGINVVDNCNIKVYFSSPLSKHISISNISIVSENEKIENPQILSVSVNQSILYVECQPLTSLYNYYLIARSTDANPFVSQNGDMFLLENGFSNKYLFSGPIDKDNKIKNYLSDYLSGSIYEESLEDHNSVISKHIDNISTSFSKAFYAIGQTKNENYLSFTVENELKTRGPSGFDRLNEESAYELLRVGLTPSSNKSNQTIPLSLKNDPVSLQSENVYNEVLDQSNDDIIGYFNLNNFCLNLRNGPVVLINSIKFTLNNSNVSYQYDIEKYGYQILDSKYNKNFSFNNISLLENQVKINDQIVNDPKFSIKDIINIEVSYQYKNLGKIISSDLEIFSSIEVASEELPPITKIFNLKHAPLLGSNNEISSLGSVSFINLNTFNPAEKHPAFINEIEYRLDSLPFLPGQYSIDYSSGTVYVFGEDSSNQGTGNFPPIISYKYKLTYKENIDYTFDSNTFDLIGLPWGSLIEQDAFANFNFEQVLIPNKDYKSTLHKEILNERIENRLIALNAIKSKNYPITNVFKIFNETSGEIYSIDRFEEDKIYFRYINPPKIVSQKNERVSFVQVSSEKLFFDSQVTNVSNLIIAKILLNNNKISSATQDSIGSSVNSSIVFSNQNVFQKGRYFDRNSNVQTNLDKLVGIGEYQVDYDNGIIFVCISNLLNLDLGFISYKYSSILTNQKNILSVEDIYYKSITNKKINYNNFDIDQIIMEDVAFSDEALLNNNTGYKYLNNNGSISVLDTNGFVSATTNDVNFIRQIFESNDLKNNFYPINFSKNLNNLTIPSLSSTVFTKVYGSGINYYADLDFNSSYISPSLTYTFQVVRVLDNVSLWDGTGVFVPGTPAKLKLSNVNSPIAGDNVKIIYTISVANLANVILDYNRGDLFVNYTYLNDEIILSYEYGDNEIDFRTSNLLKENDNYYVSYKSGALRNALFANFSNLLDIEELNELDVDFDRERYRDVLTAGLTSFLQGPTVNAIKNIAKNITHTDAKIKESLFSGWSLGNSLLVPEKIKTTGAFNLLPGKFKNGVLINQDNQTITLTSNSNLRLSEGTFEANIIPHWDGIDNNAELTFEITKDGYPSIASEIFLGVNENSPNIVNNKFKLNKMLGEGKPNMNKDGVFIYYDKDTSGNFNRWYVEIIDGYVGNQVAKYKIKIFTDEGKFYDSKIISNQSSEVSLTTGNKSLSIQTLSNLSFDHKLTFICDTENYIFDYGHKSKNRMSLFKDVNGYLVFRVIDKNSKYYSISADISEWKANDLHQVACSWKIASKNNRDEMHLFVDGFEVPNIIKYNNKLQPYLHQKFKTISKEEILTRPTKDSVSSTDLKTISGSNQVSSSLNFSSYNINIGDTILIDEAGFNSSGYTIASIAGQNLTLNLPMPLTMNAAKFSINKLSLNVNSSIDISSRFSVSRFPSQIDGYGLSTTTNSNVVNSTINFEAAQIKPGFLIRINNNSFEDIYNIMNVSGTNLILDTNMPITSSNLTFNIYSNLNEIEISGLKSIRPSYFVSKNNSQNVLNITNNVYKNDLLIIKTYGLNYKNVKSNYYIWSDGYENIIKTKLPAPIALNEISIKKVILQTLNLTSSNTVVDSGYRVFPGALTDNPVTSSTGRTIELFLSGTNTDFSNPTIILIYGKINGSPITDTILFNDYGSVNSNLKFTKIDYVDIITVPLNFSKPSITLKMVEANSLTTSEGGNINAAVRFAYQVETGYNLFNSGSNTVKDNSSFFSDYHVGNYLFVYSPPSVYGYFKIDNIQNNRKELVVSPINTLAPIPLPNFSNGKYEILNISNKNSGFQNGFITLEDSLSPGNPYFLTKGLYEIEYSSYLNIDFDKNKADIFFGSSIEAHSQLNGVLDNVKIYSSCLTDIRVGESLPSNAQSITQNFNFIKEQPATDNQLVSINFDENTFENKVKYYKLDTGNFQHSNNMINERFNNNVIIENNPIVIDNDGILNSKKEGTIEFWTSPLYDTYNDPNFRYYFDAAAAIEEEAVSLNNSSIKINSSISKILSVKIPGSPIDYFAGGTLELDDDNDVIQEERISLNNSTIEVDNTVFQVISVKINNDLSNKDYFAGGSIDANGKKIYLGQPLPFNVVNVIVVYRQVNSNKNKNTQVIRLGRKLPSHKSKVIISYIPKGNSGDRISIYKDKSGYLNFSIIASENNFTVRAPILWSSGSWHKVKASFKVNGRNNSDEMRLFIDGYQFSSVVYGSGIVYGPNPVVYGSTHAGDGYSMKTNITMKDSLNTLFIGSDFRKKSNLYSIIDNFKISNISSPIYAPFGEARDPSYNSNLNVVYPAYRDLYTTYLLDFKNNIELVDDFATIQNSGSFDFEVDIYDGLNIINDNPKSKNILEILIKKLKPATSKVFIKYL